MKAISRVLIAMIAAIAALFVSTGTSHAGLDNELSLVDGQDRTLTVQQWDTFLNGVFPLDRNRLTREWFHSGRARYIVAGPGAGELPGMVTTCPGKMWFGSVICGFAASRVARVTPNRDALALRVSPARTP